MKTPAASLLLLCTASLPAWAGVPVPSTITAATVYLDRAVVTRTGSIDVAAGEQELLFERLPAGLLDDSVQVRGRGTAAVTILDVATRQQWLDNTPNERLRALELEIEALQKQIRTLDDRAATLDQQKALLVKIGASATTPASAKDGAVPRPSTAEWQQLVDFYGTGFDKLATEKQSLDQQREELAKKIEALTAQQNELRGAGGRNVKNVVVRVKADQAGKFDVNLSYTLGGASWTPAYDARFATADRSVTLGYFGVVRQNTGEDWAGIDLTLSTARPALGGAAPTLSPWVVAPVEELLRVRQEAMAMKEMSKRRTAAPMPAAMAPTAVGMAADEAPPPVEAEHLAATVDTQATSATFRIPVRTDVPADNAPHKVGIATIPLKADLAYAATPKLLPAAFLNAAVANGSDYPLLGGRMAVFLDGTFVANTGLKTVMTGEKFDLALGADDGIRVERKLVNRFVEDLGLVSKEVRTTYDVKITVTNTKRTAEKVVLRDQVPVSRHEKITVKQVEPDAKTVKPDDDGVLVWTLDLKPGEKRELALKFSVTHPRDFAITGLE